MNADNQEKEFDIYEDGQFGPKTIEAMAELIEARNKLRKLNKLNLIVSVITALAMLLIAVFSFLIWQAQPEEAKGQPIGFANDVIIAEKEYIPPVEKLEEKVEKAEETKEIEEVEPKEETVKKSSEQPKINQTGSNFKRDGVWYDDNYRYTWYSSKVAYHYRTDEWTPGSDGIYRDKDGYVVVASSDHKQGTVIEDTPFGDAKVYDSGCASGTLDVYVNF